MITNNKNQSVAESSPRVSQLEKGLLIRSTLCGGAIVRTDRPFELCKDFFRVNYCDGMLVERLPLLIAELPSFEAGLSIARQIVPFVSTSGLTNCRQLLDVGCGVFVFALLVHNSKIVRTEYEDETIQRIHGDLAQTLAFLEGECRPAEEEIAALGLTDFEPTVYVAARQRKHN